jgi:hypothetical protein
MVLVRIVIFIITKLVVNLIFLKVEKSRVKLTSGDGVDDYINANYVSVINLNIF